MSYSRIYASAKRKSVCLLFGSALLVIFLMPPIFQDCFSDSVSLLLAVLVEQKAETSDFQSRLLLTLYGSLLLGPGGFFGAHFYFLGVGRGLSIK